MRNALIGHTGFVGSNLAKQARFSDFYNSKNISDIEGQSFDIVVCAGVYAEKWRANQEPEADWANIKALLDRLERVNAKTFVLVSTVDVYPQPKDVDEDTKIEGLHNHPYGAHRFKIERYIAERFHDHHIVRLPGLFGPGLKKNVIFDLLHDNRLDCVNPESVYQYYDVGALWQDMSTVIKNGLRLVNFATEPIETTEILDDFFPHKTVGENCGAPTFYNIRTKYAKIFGKSGSYIYDKHEIKIRMAKFIRAYPKA